jgi:SpoVK/Ycf46/Vps4 family AAA+-type ATPase
LLRQLIRAGVAGRDDEFRTLAERVIQQEREKKHHLLANDLERILYGEVSRSPRLAPRAPVPADKERGLPLIDVRQPVRDLGDLVLSDGNRSVLEEVLLEQDRVDLLAAYGLRPLARLLFCGPPGCGKTSAAEVLATELGLELAVVRFDAVISSFLGETAANLRMVFDFFNSGRFVVLFDEFDAIGKERADASDHGELKRVVSSFLQMLDGYRGASVIIAASNHEQLLDRALWRRFDEVLVFDRPNVEQIRELLGVKLRGVRYELPLDDRAFIARFKGFTHADVERVVIRSIKTMVLQGREFVTADMIESVIQREQERVELVNRARARGGDDG